MSLKTMFVYFLEAKNPCFVTKNCWKSSYICVFILSKKRRNWFHKNLHNSGMVGRRKLPDPSLNHIFNALSIGVQYTLSFQWINIGLKCLLLPTATTYYYSLRRHTTYYYLLLPTTTYYYYLLLPLTTTTYYYLLLVNI